MNIKQNVTELIGNTPLIRLNKISDETGCEIYGKCEFLNPTSSVKDRIGANMIQDAIDRKIVNKNSTIIEPTSGNTGIALASICASLGIKLILTMPESMSLERRKLLKAFGAKLVLTPKEEGMRGAIKKAKELNKTIENSIILQQFSNPANPQIHRETTAMEILKDTDKKIDFFVAGVGTGGTITGVGEVLKREIPDIKIVAVEPKSSPAISQKKSGSHKIQGIGAGFIPDVLNLNILDEIFTIEDEKAFQTSRELAKDEGLLVGISSGANVFAAKEIAKKALKGSVIVTILCDTGERYLSTELFN